MKIRFEWWARPSGDPSAICSPISEIEGNISPVACLLMDDGGLGNEPSLKWIDEGLSRLEAVLHGSIGSQDWDREDWGARITPSEVRAYSLHDESCAESIPTTAFQRGLMAWRDFVKAGSVNNPVVEIEL